VDRRARVTAHQGVAFASLGTADIQPGEIDDLRGQITFLEGPARLN